MTYQTVPVGEVKALDLRNDPEDVPFDTLRDALNVDVLDRGRLRGRVGYGIYNGTTLSLMRRFGRYVFGSSTTESYRFDTADATAVPLSGGKAADFASAGLLGDVYSCLDTRPLRKATAASGPFGADIVGTPSGNLLATTPISDRLVIARQPGDLSKVSFSGAGDPESWGERDYQRLTPGDGESVQAFATYNNELFVFKQTKFFVFSGESVSGTGTPIFNYRTMNTGKGCACNYAAVSTPNGVYFIANDGIYVTTGGPPVCVSDPVRPLFTSSPLAATSLTATNPVNGAYLTYHENRLYYSDLTRQVLVFDPQTGGWLAWQFASPVSWGLGDCVGVSPSNDNQLLWAARDGAGVLYQVGTETTDDGAAITAYARSGLADLGVDAVKTVREAVLRGDGTVTFALLDGQAGNTAQGAAVTMTEAAGVFGDARYRIAFRAARVGWQVQASGAWRLDGLTLHVRDQRDPGAA